MARRRRIASHAGELRLAREREGAFGQCLAPYRPCPGLADRIDAFLQSPDRAGEVPPPGTLDGRFFDRRVLVELRAIHDVAFEPVARRFRAEPPVQIGGRRAGMLTGARLIGHEARLLYWTYLVIWDRQTAEALLVLRASSGIALDDPDLLRAAARLEVTLA